MHSFDVKIGINPISWMNDDMPSLGGETPVETALAEGAAIGYRGFELGNKFPKEAGALRKLLAPYGLECVSGWYSGRLAHRSVEEEIEAVGPHLRLLSESGCKVMVYGEVADAIQGEPVPLYKRPRFVRSAQWDVYAARLNEFARHTLKHGVRLAYHHHMGAYVETADDIEQLMSRTGEEVGLLFDTGHITFAGSDALQVLKKHVHRVCHVHCKDVRTDVVRRARNGQWSFLHSVLNGAFTVPGDGAVAFKPLLEALHQHGYRGWLVVEAEQDPAVAPSRQYAALGHDHLASLVQELGREPGSAA